MSDDGFRIAELLLGDFKCSHVLMLMALEAQGRASPDTVRAMSGLALGLGQGFNCGALTGAAAVIGLCAGRGGEDEREDPRLAAVLDDFTGWFNGAMTERYGGINCADIINFDPALKSTRCPALIAEVWDKLLECLDAHDIDIANPPSGRGEEA